MNKSLQTNNLSQVVPAAQISGSQKFEAQPQEALVAMAQQRYSLIVQAEVTLANQYWHLGDVLISIRKKPQHGRWLDFLNTQGWSYYRVSTALRIRRKYETPDSLNGCTVEEALGYKTRFGFEPLPEDSAEDKEGNTIPQDRSVNEQAELTIGPPTANCGKPMDQESEAEVLQTTKHEEQSAQTRHPRNPEWPVEPITKSNRNSPPPPPKENPNHPLAVLVKIRERLVYLFDEVKHIDWKVEPSHTYRTELDNIVSIAQNIAKEVPHE